VKQTAPPCRQHTADRKNRGADRAPNLVKNHAIAPENRADGVETLPDALNRVAYGLYLQIEGNRGSAYGIEDPAYG
jgi:hypothetical protein